MNSDVLFRIKHQLEIPSNIYSFLDRAVRSRSCETETVQIRLEFDYIVFFCGTRNVVYELVLPEKPILPSSRMRRSGGGGGATGSNSIATGAGGGGSSDSLARISNGQNNTSTSRHPLPERRASPPHLLHSRDLYASLPTRRPSPPQRPSQDRHENNNHRDRLPASRSQPQPRWAVSPDRSDRFADSKGYRDGYDAQYDGRREEYEDRPRHDHRESGERRRSDSRSRRRDDEPRSSDRGRKEARSSRRPKSEKPSGSSNTKQAREEGGTKRKGAQTTHASSSSATSKKQAEDVEVRKVAEGPVVEESKSTSHRQSVPDSRASTTNSRRRPSRSRSPSPKRSTRHRSSSPPSSHRPSKLHSSSSKPRTARRPRSVSRSPLSPGSDSSSSSSKSLARKSAASHNSYTLPVVDPPRLDAINEEERRKRSRAIEGKLPQPKKSKSEVPVVVSSVASTSTNDWSSRKGQDRETLSSMPASSSYRRVEIVDQSQQFQRSIHQPLPVATLPSTTSTSSLTVSSSTPPVRISTTPPPPKGPRSKGPISISLPKPSHIPLGPKSQHIIIGDDRRGIPTGPKASTSIPGGPKRVEGDDMSRSRSRGQLDVTQGGSAMDQNSSSSRQDDQGRHSDATQFPKQFSSITPQYSATSSTMEQYAPPPPPPSHSQWANDPRNTMAASPIINFAPPPTTGYRSEFRAPLPSDPYNHARPSIPAQPFPTHTLPLAADSNRATGMAPPEPRRVSIGQSVVDSLRRGNEGNRPTSEQGSFTTQATPSAVSSVVLAGNTEIYERIVQVGEGTYGKVYKAKNVETGGLVALKRIRMEAEKDGFPVTAVREIKLLQNLKHPNVVDLIEMMVSKNHVYMVFEYVDHDLTGVLHHPSIHFTPAQLKSLMKQLLEGLGFIHRRGVLHRDLKGSNILLSKKGELKIADFGLARFYAKGRGNDYTNRVITQWYKPPELLFGATVYGSEVDMWSVGCIFLELFARRPVFQGQDEIHQLEVIFKVTGTPSVANWPALRNLPWYELVKPPVTIESQLREMYAKWLTPAGLDVAERLLYLDPLGRPDCETILQMEYFTTEAPAPEMPEISVKGEWHEYESKRARKKQREETV